MTTMLFPRLISGPMRYVTVTRCNSLQRTATLCNTRRRCTPEANLWSNALFMCKTLQRTTIHSYTLQHMVTLPLTDVFTQIHTYIYLPMYTWMYVQLCLHKYIHMYIYLCTHACMCSCVYTNTFIYTFTYIHMHVCTYIYIHIHIIEGYDSSMLRANSDVFVMVHTFAYILAPENICLHVIAGENDSI